MKTKLDRTVIRLPEDQAEPALDRAYFHWDNAFQQMLKRVFIMKIDNVEQKSRQALMDCFQQVPFLDPPQEVTALEDTGVDFVFRIVNRKEQTPYLLAAEVKDSGQPRFIQQGVNQLKLYQQENEEITYSALLAPYISEQSAQICKENGIGYVDLAGNCYLSFASVFIEKEGNPNPYTQDRELKSIFYPKSERILRVLLNAGPREWLTEELAEEAGVSLGQVSNVRKYLDNQGWLDPDSSRLQLGKPLEMLNVWARNYSFRKNEIIEYYSLGSPAETEQRLTEAGQTLGLTLSFTGFSGGSRYASMVRYQRVMAYLEDGFDRLESAADLKPVSSGANVLLLKPYDRGVFYQSRPIDEMPVVSPIQAYLDLASYRGRGEEAAQALLDQEIRKIW